MSGRLGTLTLFEDLFSSFLLRFTTHKAFEDCVTVNMDEAISMADGVLGRRDECGDASISKRSSRKENLLNLPLDSPTKSRKRSMETVSISNDFKLVQDGQRLAKATLVPCSTIVSKCTTEQYLQVVRVSASVVLFSSCDRIYTHRVHVMVLKAAEEYALAAAVHRIRPASPIKTP